MKKKNDYRDKNILVIGFAKSGVASANLLKGLGAVVTITDKKNINELGEFINMISEGINLKTGDEMNISLINDKDMIVVSPGVPIDNFMLTEAKRKGVEIVSEVELACSLTKVPIIAITGTNGKTTTTTLINEILSNSGKNIFLGGNIGRPLTDGILEASDCDYITAEISSFQLEHVDSFKPFISLILNITPDHLDRHKTLSAYSDCKRLVYKKQDKTDFLILNFDDEMLRGFKDAKSKVIYFSRKSELEEGVFLRGDEVISRLNSRSDEVIVKVSEIKVFGNHNIENVLAAICACLLCKVEVKSIVKTVSTFKGLSHRMEFVREISGVTFFNDSKATNVGAMAKSLESLKKPVVLIAGGKDKGNNYSDVFAQVTKKVKLVIAIGSSADIVKNAFNDKAAVIKAETMDDAVKKSFENAAFGDVVLLSPACASFDMFKDYKDRGEKFKNSVNKLLIKG